jgi:hypothetical protein
MKHAVDLGRGAMMYVPSFIMICLGIQKLLVRVHIHSHRAWQSYKPIFIFQIKKKKAKNGTNAGIHPCPKYDWKP